MKENYFFQDLMSFRAGYSLYVTVVLIAVCYCSGFIGFTRHHIIHKRLSVLNAGSSHVASFANKKRSNLKQMKAARIVRDEISDIICRCDIKANNYPDAKLLSSTSVSSVELSSDLGYAKVFLTVAGNSVEKRQIFVWLNKNMGQVRYTLARRLKQWRRVPSLVFSMVDSRANLELQDLLEELSAERARKEGVGVRPERGSSVTSEDDDDEYEYDDDENGDEEDEDDNDDDEEDNEEHQTVHHGTDG